MDSSLHHSTRCAFQYKQTELNTVGSTSAVLDAMYGALFVSNLYAATGAPRGWEALEESASAKGVKVFCSDVWNF